MFVKELKRLASEWYNGFVKQQVESASSYQYIREVALGLIVAAVVGGGFWGYRYYQTQKETSAQVAFAEVMHMYRDAMQGKTDVWPQVETQSSLLYDKYKKSSVAPYLLMIKSDALAQQGKLAQAVTAIDSVIEHMPKEFPVLSIYKTKRALMKIDMTDPTLQTAGLDELRSLASDKDNKNSDVAQYYLGLYYWSRNELDNAVQVWKELVQSQAHEKIAMSPWASLAQEKLAQRAQLPEQKPIVAPAA